MVMIGVVTVNPTLTLMLSSWALGCRMIPVSKLVSRTGTFGSFKERW